MKLLDRFIQNWRIRKALPCMPGRVRVLDVGAHHGELFHALGGRLQEGFGIEPVLTTPLVESIYKIYPGLFPAVRPPGDGWDAITMLAVLEHIPRSQQAALANACHELLKTGGRVIITVPSKTVDHILAVLKFLRLIDGMSLEEHFGFEPDETPRIFAQPRFKLVCAKRFQLGLNHLFVFEKIAPK